jgi:hypothetical protein
VEIREFGLYVTCFLRMSAGGNEWDSVEALRFEEHDRVAEIRAL